MTYPGNPSLASAVRDRVSSTFQQALTLYKQGRHDDVIAGCNLILQMDAMFDPAKKLLEKTRNPAAPIDVDSLGTPASAAMAPLEAARQAMASRDFNRVIHITGEILSNDLMNEEARLLGDEAREKLEAEPFVEQFARKCDQQLAAGNLSGARLELEKARALDATHPDVVRVGKAIAARASAPAPAPPQPSSSFVVDDRAQQATGRASTPAADFGFTFEEDAKPAAGASSFANFSFDGGGAPAAVDDSNFANFSFDAPATANPEAPFSGFSFGGGAAPASHVEGSPHEFDFTTASIATSDDDQQKIDHFLADGDRAFTAGDYQQAIDLWSRIFLIDVTNEQASERIERAKSKRRDTEEELDTRLAAAVAAFERRDFNAARNELGEVLRLDPHNAQAHDYMDRLESAMQHPPRAAAAAGTASAGATPAADDLDFGAFDDELPAGSEAPLVPPDPGTRGATPAAKAKKSEPAKARPAAAPRKLPMGALAAIVGILVLGAAGWFAWSRFQSEPQPEPGATQAVFTRATRLANSGKFDQAIALLQDVRADDPQHDRALVMIADLQQKKSKAASTIDGIPANEYYDQKLAAARTAFDGHDYAAAKAAFDEAQRVRPLTPDLKALYDTASQQVVKLDAAKSLFAERKYADAIAALQPLLVEDPQNQNIARMIVNAHFNLGATALQEEKLDDAIREFDEVLKSEPNDELARRSRELAVRYKDETKDLLYHIYVKYLPLRQAT